MSQAVIASNVSLKISASVALSGISNSSSLVVYTVPANSYAVVNVGIADNVTGDTSTFFLGSATASTAMTVYNTNGTQAGTTRIYDLYLGPGEVLRFNSGGAGFKTWYVRGVEFINSP